MKISKRQLKRIIKEERAKLQEAGFPEDYSGAVNELFKILQGMDVVDRNAEIYMLIDDLEELASKG